MGFPNAPRVIYEKNPLEEVICQLRFPTILKIESEVPSSFQERIRSKFPFYKTKQTLKPPAGIPPELADILAREIPLGVGKTAHEFTSKDQNWRLSLTREFIAITCRRYERWELFKEWFTEPLQALLEIYSPAFFTRIGLRYQDIIRRSNLGLTGNTWAELLQPWIAGAFGDATVAPDVEHSKAELVLRLPENQGLVRIIHGVVREESATEDFYQIDADFFQDKQETETTHALTRLDYFNTQARLLFRWCIQDNLHRAMGPRPI